MPRKPYSQALDTAVAKARRAVASWLGLLLILFNLVGAGALALRPTDSTPSLFTQALRQDVVVVCTASGMEIFDRSSGKPIDSGSPASSGGMCVFCLPLLHGTTITASADFATTEPAFSRLAVVPPPTDILSALTAAVSPYPARAPPAIA